MRPLLTLMLLIGLPVFVFSQAPTINITTAPPNVDTFCVGGNIDITANVTGGVGPFTYVWSTGAVTPTINTNASGNFCVTVTGANAATASACYQVTVVPDAVLTWVAPPGPNFNAAICSGGNYDLTIQLSGGYPGCTLTWWVSPTGIPGSYTIANTTVSTGAGTYVYNTGPLVARQYYLVGFSCGGANGCDSITSQRASVLVVTDPSITLSPNITQVCDAANLNLTALTGGGTGGCTVQLYTSPDNTPGSYVPLGPAQPSAPTVLFPVGPITGVAYFQAVMTCGGNGCNQGTSNIAIVISNPDPQVTDIAPLNSSVCNTQTIPFTATVTGGTGTCTISWQESLDNGNNWTTIPGATGANPTLGPFPSSRLIRAVYSCTGAGCDPGNSAPATVTVVDPIQAAATASSPVCSGTLLNLNVNHLAGGPFTYSWAGPGGYTSNIRNPVRGNVNVGMSGQYCVTVTDNNGCTSTSCITVTVQPSPVGAIAAGGPTTFCQGGSVVLTASSNIGGSTFLWTGGAVTAAITPTTTGNYCVTVTSPTGCRDTVCQQVTVNPNPSAPTINITDNTPCINSPISISVQGPVGGQNYSWNFGAGATPGTATGAGPHSVTYSIAGPTSVTVTTTIAATGCTATATSAITVNPLPGNPTINAPANLCVDQLGNFSIAGPLAGATYQWNFGAGATPATASGVGPHSVSYSTAGSKSACVTVTDANGCTASTCVTVQVNANPTPFNVTGGGAFCNGGAGLVVGLSGSQVGVNYQLLLNGNIQGAAVPGTGSAISFGTQTQAGTYTVTATNAATGCGSLMTGSVVITINPNPVVTITAGGPVTFCAGGQVVLTASSAPAPSTYLWTGGATTASITATVSGNYCVTVTDINGCTGSACRSVQVNPNPGIFNMTGGGAYCAGGPGIALGLSGSEMGVNYQLQLNGSNIGAPVPGNGGVITFGNQTQAGTYTVIATNIITGCTSTMNGNLVITVNPTPTPFNVTGGGAYCTGGAGVLVGLSDSELGINYQLQLNGANLGGPVAGTGNALNFGNQTQAGTYTVVATNATTGCTATMTGNVVVSIISNPSVAITANGPTSFCPGGVVVLTANPTPATNEYLWSTGATTQSITVGVAGTVSVTITIAGGCTATATETVGVFPPATAAIAANGPTTFCQGGSVTLTASGNPAASFIWSTGETTGAITPTAAGNYCVTVTNANGCTASVCEAVSVLSNPEAFAGPGGAIAGLQTYTPPLPTATGGAPGYTYLWSTSPVVNGNSSTLEQPTFGPFTTNTTICLTVTDANGCTGTSCTLIDYTPCSLSSTIDAASQNGVNILCFGDATGAIDLTVSGGSGSYAYNWSGPVPIGAIEDPSNLPAGSYTVTVTDNVTLCTVTNTIVLVQPAAALTAGTCTVANDQCQVGVGEIQVQAQGGTAPYTVTWVGVPPLSPPSPQTILLSGGVILFTGATGGATYNFTVTDANGCHVP